MEGQRANVLFMTALLKSLKDLSVNKGQTFFSVLLEKGGRDRKEDVGSMNGRTFLTIFT